MAIDNETLQSFFQKQKKASTDALVSCIPKIKNQLPLTNTYKKTQKYNTNIKLKPLAKREQTVSKPLAKREQTVSKPLAKREQTVSKPLANKKRNDNNDNETVSKPLAEPLAKREQTVSKPLAKSSVKVNIEMLVGKEKKLLLIALKRCQMLGSLETSIITTEELKNTLKVEANHLRNVIFRVVNKQLLEVIEFKNGRSGWRKFRLPKDVFQSLSIEETVSKALANREQTVSKALVQPLAMPLSSSSDLIKTTTTDESNFEKNLDSFENWKKVDLSPLTEIGFSQTHLFQIAKQNLIAPEVVQESIYSFAFDLTKNGKAKLLKKTPLDFFMGILRNGSAYAPPQNYKSQKEIALEAFIEQKNRIQALEEKAIHVGFQNWVSKLTADEKNNIIPEETKKMGYPALINQALRTYFKENVWPNMGEEMMLQKVN